MGVHFVSSIVSAVHYRGSDIENRPVNLALVRSISCVTTRWYPDNLGIPGLRFHTGAGEDDPVWNYRSTDDRDEDLERILKERS